MKKDGKRVQSNGAGNWFGYIRCDFDKGLREQFNETVTGPYAEAALEWFLTRPNEGFRVSVSWDAAGKSFLASMTGNDPAYPTCYGWTLTARARDVERAVCALFFKHTVILKNDWSDHAFVRDDQTEGEGWVK